MKLKAKYVFTLILSLAGLAPSQALAQTAPSTAGEDFEAAWPNRLHNDMIRVEKIGWQMRTLAVASCPQTSSAIGVALDDALAYAKDAQDYVKSVTGLGDWPQVLTSMPDSPAAKAGLRAGDAIIAVAGTSVDAIAAAARRPTLRAEAIKGHIVALPAGQPFPITVLREGTEITFNVTPVAACSSQFVVTTRQGLDAYSDENNIALTAGLVEFTANDDELAFLMGHEFAHIIHRDVNGVPGRARRSSKQIERDADALGADLTYCVGRDPRRGADYWVRYRKSDWKTLFGSLSHPSFRSRTAYLRAYTPPAKCPPRARVAIAPR